MAQVYGLHLSDTYICAPTGKGVEGGRYGESRCGQSVDVHAQHHQGKEYYYLILRLLWFTINDTVKYFK